MRLKSLLLGIAVGLGLSASVHAQDTIKLGALATLEGAFTVLGEDGMRGVELALKQRDYTAGGKKIELVQGSSDASPDSAIRAARKLVEQGGVDILIPAGDDVCQRYLGRPGHHATRPGRQLFPVLHRRRAVDGGPGRVCV